MAKPNSFNKRELEKKREQKRKEKQKRKEDRKANNSSNGSFEDMIAYVDENGNITTTPVSPDKKQEVDAENIAVSTPKKEKVEDIILKGRVEHFNEGKGYGFIKDIDSTEKYFFHITDAFDTITEGMMVSFELEKGHRGLNAVRITLAN